MRILLLTALVLACLSSCSQNSSRKTHTGLEVKVLREGEGAIAGPGQFLSMNVLYKDSKDSVWDDNRKRGIPMLWMVADTSSLKNEKGIESIFRVLKKNDSVQATVTAKSLFEETWKQPLPSSVKPEENVTFVISCLAVMDRRGADSLWQIIQSKRQEMAEKKAKEQLAIDSVAIDAYLSAKNIVAIKAASGVRYVITKKGTGPKPEVSNTISFRYKGTLLDNGTLFDESAEPIQYPLAQLIAGWQIVFPQLPKGTKATLYVPSSLGYGPAGSPPVIPPNANLVFEVELVDFN